MRPIRKYPRTRHLIGSRLQPGDEDLSQVPITELVGRYHVVEEKIDGAHAGLSFDSSARLWLQSRGHYLTGGGMNEGQFSIVKAWAHTVAPLLQPRIEDRYVVYAEVPYKRHTVYYDTLPHYFLEFDILDTLHDRFLSTRRRRALLAGLPIVSVPVLFAGLVTSLDQLLALLGTSLFKSPSWRTAYDEAIREAGLDAARAWDLVDDTDLAEGLYIKHEDDDWVVRGGTDPEDEHRYKWVRADFHQHIVDANEDGGHVQAQPTIVNRLAPTVDIFDLGLV